MELKGQFYTVTIPDSPWTVGEYAAVNAVKTTSMTGVPWGYSVTIDDFVLSQNHNLSEGTIGVQVDESIYDSIPNSQYAICNFNLIEAGEIAASVPVKVVIGNIGPTIDNPSIKNVVDILGSSTLFVQGVSSINVTGTARPSAGSKVASIRIDIGDTGYTYKNLNDDTNTFAYLAEYYSGYGNIPVSITVIDSRGLSCTHNTTIYVNQYTKPTIQRFDVSRCTSASVYDDEGIYARMDYKYACSTLLDNGTGTEKNTGTLRLEYSTDGENWTGIATINNLSAEAYYRRSYSIGTTTKYYFRATLTDAMGETAQKVGAIEPVTYCMTFGSGGQSMALGKKSSNGNGEFECAWVAKFTGGIQIDGVPLADYIYPVGAIYMSTVSTNPGTLFGGTWMQIKDKFLLAAGTNHTAGTTGGSESNELRALIGAVGNNTGYIGYKSADAVTGQDYYFGLKSNGSTDTGTVNHSTVVTDSAGNETIDNMPPYLAVYVWKRTA